MTGTPDSLPAPPLPPLEPLGQDPVASVGFEYGFESEAAFSRAFKGEFGKPPAAWRKE